MMRAEASCIFTSWFPFSSSDKFFTVSESESEDELEDFEHLGDILDESEEEDDASVRPESTVAGERLVYFLDKEVCDPNSCFPF